MARTKPAPVPVEVPATRRRTAPALTSKVAAPVRRRVPPAPKTATEGKQAGTPRRGSKIVTTFTEFFHNWGGCLPFVDINECPHHRVFRQKQKDGVVYWIDNGICKQFCPNGKKFCPRYEEYWKRGGARVDHEEFMTKRFKAAGVCHGGS